MNRTQNGFDHSLLTPWIFKRITPFGFIISKNVVFFNDVSLMRYDVRRCRMIYLLRKHDIISVPAYAEGIYHRTIVRYHIEDISPVPQGTDIIVKNLFCLVDKRGFSLSKNFQYASVSDIIKETGVFLWSNGEKMQEVKRSSWI